jgi:hypothetical protein
VIGLSRCIITSVAPAPPRPVGRPSGCWFPSLYGDGGPATEAEFDGPWGVAVTADGGIVIVDSNNNVVRKVLPA